MSDARSGAGGTRGAGTGGRRGEPPHADFQASVTRLQRAVDELVTTATDRASTVIDETSRRLERELDRRQRRADRRARREGPAAQAEETAAPRRPGESDYDDAHRPDRRGYAAALYTGDGDEGMARGLYRDVRRAKLCGVCAGIARYYGVEPWVVRCVAITGLLFFPTIVFPAYFIACFIMDKPPGPNDGRRRRSGRRERHGRDDHRSPAPELGPRFSPRYGLRNVQADLTEIELRLRRMETHVTSGHYELQRELNKIDGGSDG